MPVRSERTPTELGRRIQRVVDEKGMMKKDFARSLGVSPNYIYQIIAGKRDTMSESLARLIETLYGYPSGWVLRGSADADELAEAIRKLERMGADKVRSAIALLEKLEKEDDTP